MIEINGEYSQALVYTDTLAESAMAQIKSFCNQQFSAGSKITVMPDICNGREGSHGITMQIYDKVFPSVIAADIGCGILAVKLREKQLDVQKIKKFIYENIPVGDVVRQKPHRKHEKFDIYDLHCVHGININQVKESLGTLGGGNHFIEIGTDGENLYLVIHTGSRNLGLKVAEYYQEKAYTAFGGRKQTEIPYELAYLEGEDMQAYLHDMELMQKFADLNRMIIKEVILDGMKLDETESFTTVHNYINLESMILRKGAVSAEKDERLLIPLNMRDGSMMCTGLGNEEWNCSAPHGAGRLMSRGEAYNSFTLSAFKESMQGIFTTSVSKETIDECPMVYKQPKDIIAQIKDTVNIEKIIKPIYNFKASETNGRRRK